MIKTQNAIQVHGAKAVYAAACSAINGDYAPLAEMGIEISSLGDAYRVQTSAFKSMSKGERAADKMAINNEMMAITRRGAPKGSKNNLKDGRDTHFNIRTSAALKGAAKVAAMPGGVSDLINNAVREYIRTHRPDVVERFPDAFKDEQ